MPFRICNNLFLFQLTSMISCRRRQLRRICALNAWAEELLCMILRSIILKSLVNLRLWAGLIMMKPNPFCSTNIPTTKLMPSLQTPIEYKILIIFCLIIYKILCTNFYLMFENIVNNNIHSSYRWKQSRFAIAIFILKPFPVSISIIVNFLH